MRWTFTLNPVRGLAVLFFCAFLLQTQTVFAQVKKTFRGTVVTPKGEPVTGASITVKGQPGGTLTDSTGAFTIYATEGATLSVTGIGYSAQEFVLKGSGDVAVTLSQTSGGLDEVVVVAYGTQRRRDITGSVAVVNVAEAKKYSTNDVAQLLQGRAAGVQVSNDGQPGSIPSVRIRGVGTFGNTQPLYVVDGVQVGTGIRDFSPNDIESIQVLKDASAAALYGSQAANGVIIITTRQGRKNTGTKIEYNGNYGVDKVWQRQDVANRATYQLLNNEARRNAGVALAPGNDPANAKFINNVDTDWQREGLKSGPRTNQNISFYGGGATNTYNISLDYFDQKGTYVGNGPSYTRYTARVNSTAEKGIFKIGENIFYARSHENTLTNTLSSSLAGALPPLINILNYAVPTLSVFNPANDGGYNGTLSDLQDVISMNGIGLNSLFKNSVDVDRIFANVYGELQFIKRGGHNLRYRLNVSYDRTQTRDYAFQPSFNLGYFFQSPIARLDDNTRSFTNGLIENTLTYQKNFGRHKVDAVAGQTYFTTSTLTRLGHAEGFAKPYYPTLSNGSVSSASGFETDFARLSYLASVKYNFDDRYLLTVSGRRDASSRFAKAIRVGYFPSVALGWRLTNEKFLNLPKNVVTDIKLRASYGKLGNDNIADYAYQPFINSGVPYTFNGVRYVGGIQTNLVDENIKWEDRSTSNIGLDAVLLKGAVDFTAEYYKNKTNDLLVGVPINAFYGSINSFPTVNAGSLQNSGVEFSATYHKTKGSFTFDIGANFSTLKNKVLSLGGNNDPIDGVGSRTQVGQEVGQHFGYLYDGIFQNAGEVTAHATQPGAAAGDIRFKDISGPDGKPDGVITPLDRTFLGSAIPKYNYGINLTAGYKGFDLSVFASGSGKFLINSRMYRSLMHTGGSDNYMNDMLDRWTPTNTNTDIPRVHTGDPNQNDRNSNRPGWLQSGTYLRINTLSAGYNFKTGIIKGITKARVFVTAQNLYTFQSYRGYNPDFNSGVFNPGYDDGSYPRPRTMMAGVQVGF